MDLREFETRLKADGYQEIETQDLAARPGNGRHRHPFAIRGLVLSGTFLVTQKWRSGNIRSRSIICGR
jgi:hypothetical protein